MKHILANKRRNAATRPAPQQPSARVKIKKRPKIGLLFFCMLATGLTTSTQGQELLINEDFSRSAKGTLLEQSSGFEWQAEEGRLIIGNGRALNGQALSYAPNRTWANQIYHRKLNATLAPGEAVEMSFSAAVKTDASPEFYIYAMRLYDGDDYIQIQLKGGESAPHVIVERMLNGQKTSFDATGAAYYQKTKDTGLAAVGIVISNNSAQAYFDQDGTGKWVAIGAPVECQLTTLDRAQLRYYAMGFWSAMDDLKVAIGKLGQ